MYWVDRVLAKMREIEMSFLSRLVPRRTATVYCILFLTTTFISITVMHVSEKVFREYTSCHGDHEHDITIFMVMILMQSILLLLKVEDGEPVEDSHAEVDAPRSFHSLDRDGNFVPDKKLSESLELTSKRFISNEGFVGIIRDTYNDPDSRQMSPCISMTRPESSRSVGLNTSGMSQAISISTTDNIINHNNNTNNAANNAEASRTNNYINQRPRPCQYTFARFSICWNSLWMIFYHLVIFMAFHATMLASRIHGTIELNKYALETCGHLWGKFPLDMWSPKLKYPLISENTFFLTYLSCLSFELVTRKSADASYVSNFFSGHFFKDCRMFGVLRIMFQCVIFLYGGYIICVSIMFGYGSPMQILSGFAFGMLTLWLNAALTQLLQLSHMATSTLELNWFWSLLSALNFWICGLLFYMSVYGIPFTTPYLYLQICAWLPILILTKQKGKQIFEWRDISYALYAFN